MKNILIALAVAALPALAQDAPAPCQKECGAPKCHRPCGPKPGMHKHMMEKFDANKDGQLDEQEKEAMKAEFEAKKAERKAKFMEKFDVNKDGQIDDQEKEAIKAEFEARQGKPGCKGPRGHHPHGPKPGCKGPRGHRPHGPNPGMHKHMMEKFDANKDGQLDEQEKEAMKAEFEAKKAERKAKFMEKFDVNKDGQIDDQEKEAIKADFEAKKAEFEAKRGDKKPGCGKKDPRGEKCCGPKGPKGPRGHKGHGPCPVKG